MSNLTVDTPSTSDLRLPDALEERASTRRFDGASVLPVVLLILLVVVLLPISPLNRPYPPRDSGVYLYAGQQMLRGALPYRDVWDHRPPVIFYVNALGLWLGGGTLWGMWALEAVLLAAAVLLSYTTLKRAFGELPAFFATALWILALVFLYDGNLTEEYALPLQFAALFLFARAEEKERFGWRGILMGALLALALNLRQNLIGVWLGIGLFLVLRALFARRLAGLDLKLMSMLVGALAVIFLIALYLGVLGILPDMWQSGFVYNFIYAGTTFAKRWEAVKYGASLLARAGIFFPALGGWLIGSLSLWGRRAQPVNPLLGVALVALPVEVVLSTLSGRPYAHYFIALLPVFAVLAAYFAHLLMEGAKAVSAAQGYRIPAGVWLVALLLAMCLIPFRRYSEQIGYRLYTPLSLQARTVEFIRNNTAETDSVLIWGIEPSVNFLSNRTAGTHYANLLALFMPGYHNPALYQSFVTELLTTRPVFIVDTAPWNRMLPPLDAEARARWLSEKEQNINPLPEWDSIEVQPEMDVIFNTIAANYHRVGAIGSWVVYARNDVQLPGS